MQQKTPSGMVFMRVELGITQQQLADILGISRSLLAMAERGHRSLPSTGTACFTTTYGHCPQSALYAKAHAQAPPQRCQQTAGL